MTTIDKLRAKRAAMIARNRVLSIELNDIEIVAREPGWRGPDAWSGVYQKYLREFQQNHRRIEIVTRSIERETQQIASETWLDFTATTRCNCSLSGASLPVEFAGLQDMTPFSEMADVQGLHQKNSRG